MKKILSMLAVMAIVSVGLVVGAVSASAHVPSYSASCDGITVSGTDYQKKNNDPKPNSWDIKIDGSVVKSGDFGKSFNAHANVPQDGAVHTWSVKIDGWDGYDLDKSGKVGPCGEAPDVETGVTAPTYTPGTCDAPGKLYLPKSDKYTWNETGEWNARSATATAKKGFVLTGQTVFGPYDLTQKSAKSCATQPDAVVTHDTSETLDCTALLVTIHHSTTTTEYVWSDAEKKYVPGTPVTVQDADTTREATLTECPAGDLPAPKVTESEWSDSSWACGDTTTTQSRTVVTTPYKYGDDGRSFVLDTDNATTDHQTRTRNLTGDEITDCPVVVVPPTVTPTTPPVTETVTPTPTETVTPPVTETTTAPVVTTTASPTVTTPAKQLAYTGFNAWIYAGIGLALILAGGVLFYGTRLDRKH